MKLSLSTPTGRVSAKRIEWSWCGFGAGLLGYVVLSAVFGTVPDDTTLKVMWLGLGLAPALMGLCVGYTLAGLLE